MNNIQHEIDECIKQVEWIRTSIALRDLSEKEKEGLMHDIEFITFKIRKLDTLLRLEQDNNKNKEEGV